MEKLTGVETIIENDVNIIAQGSYIWGGKEVKAQ